MRFRLNVLFALPLFLVLACSADSTILSHIRLPDGFSIQEYADVPQARSLALGDNGVVFVSNRRASSVYAVVPQESLPPAVIKILDGLDTPNGIAYFRGDLYVAEVDRILVYREVDDRLRDMPEPEPLAVSLPSASRHGWRYIGIGPDNRLYVAIGAPCNICDRGSEGYAQIWRMNLDGSSREAFAQGVRNSVGFTWHPETGEMWFTDNGRDMLGDDLPPGELNVVTEPGQHFGYPFCHAGDIPDPEYGIGVDCSEYVPPAQKLGPHVAPLGLAFYTGDMFPEEYRGQIFLAEHGSWNRSKKIGYRVMLIRLREGRPVAYESFADGWLQEENVSGRPVDVLVLADGSMIVSDDWAGKLYRITYNGDPGRE